MKAYWMTSVHVPPMSFESIATFRFPVPVPELLLPPSLGPHHTDYFHVALYKWIQVVYLLRALKCCGRSSWTWTFDFKWAVGASWLTIFSMTPDLGCRFVPRLLIAAER